VVGEKGKSAMKKAAEPAGRGTATTWHGGEALDPGPTRMNGRQSETSRSVYRCQVR